MLSTVFQIFSKKLEPDFINVWNPGNRISSSGSGFGIEIKNKKYILTNAHVAEHSNYIECVKYNSDKRFPLKIIDIASEIDLAILSTDNEFWEGVSISKISTPPLKGESIKVIGFPQGGSNPSITKGVVSRIIPVLYSKSILNLALQVDSAINPGNSGGPVYNDNDEIVGVAFSHSVKAQNISYIIPSFIIQYYIKAIIQFGKFPGICDLDIESSSMENDFSKIYYLNDNSPGILVDRVNPIGTTGHLLKSGDVIHKIDNIQINNDQTIYMRKYEIVSETSDAEKIPYWYLLRLKYPGDNVEIIITRDKKRKKITFKIEIMSGGLVPSLFKKISRNYYIFGGLIFIPLNFWYLYKNDERGFSILDISKYGLFKYIDTLPESSDEEIIILSDILQTPLTSGYKIGDVKLCKIDDIPVKNIKHLYELCESHKSAFIKFEFENNKIIILNTEIARSLSEQISQNYLKVKYNNIENASDI